MEYLDFEIELRPGAGREYPVAVKSSPAGASAAPETLRFPFGEHDLALRLKDLRIALLQSAAREQRLVASPEEQAVQDFGAELFKALVVGDVQKRYDASKIIARTQRKGLRLKLHIKAPEMAALPWEFLYDTGEGKYVGLSRSTPVIRYLDLERPPQPIAVSPPLRILGMAATPGGSTPLKVKKEMERVEKAVRDLRDAGVVELVWMRGQTWQDLQNEMGRGPWHIFHFIGHGGFDPVSGEGGIVLADDEGEPFILRASQLGLLLDGHDPLRLVLLNSCEGAAASRHDILSSAAGQVMAQGIPAVLAMQYEITDTAAVEFSRAFYGALTNGLPVDAAVTEGRKAIKLAGDRTVEWGTPVLYMRSPDGNIFDVRGPRDEEQKRRKVEDLWGAARAAAAAESWDDALQKLQALVALDPSHEGARKLLSRARTQHSLSALYAEGERRYRRRDWPGAAGFLQQVVEREPEYKDARALLDKARRRSERKPLKARLAAADDAVRAWAAAHARLLLLSAVGLALLVLGGWAAWRYARREPVKPVKPDPRTENLKVEKKEEPVVTRPVARPLAEFSAPFRLIQLALSHDGGRGAYVGNGREVGVWEGRAAGAGVGWRGPAEAVCVAAGPDGQTFAAGFEDGTIMLWSGSNRPVVLVGKEGRVFELSFSADGSRVLAASERDDGAKVLRVLPAGGGEASERWTTASGDIVLAVNAERRSVAVQTGDKKLRLLSPGGVVTDLTTERVEATVAAFTADGRRLAVGDAKGVHRVWQLGDPATELRSTSEAAPAPVSSIGFSPDGGALAVGWGDGSLRVWPQFQDPQGPSVTLETKGKEVVTLSLGKGGEVVAAGRSDKKISVWRIENEKAGDK